MKDLDSIKWILVFSLIATLGFGGTYLWLRRDIKKLDRQLRVTDDLMANIGVSSNSLKVLRKEQDRNKLKDKSDQATWQFLEEIGRISGVKLANMDNKGKKNFTGYNDYTYQLDWGNVDLDRERIFRFLYNVEVSSPRIRLAALDLKLDSKTALNDKWSVQMTFVRREAE